MAVEWHTQRTRLRQTPTVNSATSPRPAAVTFLPLPFMSQVTTLPSSSALSHPSRHSTTMPPDSSTDPAELLRQAALSSRKLKRRKLEASAPLSRPLSRPLAPSPSISLDYGQEEEPSSTGPTSPQPPASALDARAPTPPQPLASGSPPRAVQRDGSSGAPARTPPLDDDTSLREEGEISENEEDPPFRAPSKPIPPPITVTPAVYPDIRLEASGSVYSPSFSVMSSSPSVNTEEACQHAATPAFVTTPVTRSEAQFTASRASETFRLETPSYVLDPDHVRPGLFCASISFRSRAVV